MKKFDTGQCYRIGRDVGKLNSFRKNQEAQTDGSNPYHGWSRRCISNNENKSKKRETGVLEKIIQF